MANRFAPRQTIIADPRISAIPPVPQVIPAVWPPPKHPIESGHGQGSVVQSPQRISTIVQTFQVRMAQCAPPKHPVEMGLGHGSCTQGVLRIDAIAPVPPIFKPVCQTSQHPVEFGNGQGSVMQGFQQMVPIPSLVNPAPSPVVVRETHPPRMPAGDVLTLRSPFQSQMPVTPMARVIFPIDRTVNPPEYKFGPGSVISSHGMPITVDTIPKTTEKLVVRPQERIPHNGDVVISHGGTDAGTLVTPNAPILVAQSEWRPERGSFFVGWHTPGLADPQTRPVIVRPQEQIPHNGSILTAHGGVDSLSAVTPSHPTVIYRNESTLPARGSVFFTVGMPDNQSLIARANPAVVVRHEERSPHAGGVLTFIPATRESIGPTAPVVVAQREERRPDRGCVITSIGQPDSIAAFVRPPVPIIVRESEYRHFQGSVWYRNVWPSTLPPIVNYAFDFNVQIDFAFDVTVQDDFTFDVNQQIDFSADVAGPP